MNSTSPRFSEGSRFQFRLYDPVLAITLSIILPVSIIVGSQDAGISRVWILTGLLSIFSGYKLSRLIVRGQARLFIFSFWLYTYIFLGLAPTAVLRSGHFPVTTPNIIYSDLSAAGLIVIAGVASVTAGYRLTSRRLAKNPVKRTVRFEASGPRIILLYIAGLLFSVYFVSKVGIGALILSRIDRSAKVSQVFPDSAEAALFSSAAWVPMQVTTLAIITQHRRRIWRTWSTKLLATVGLGLTLLINNPLSGARYHVGSMLFAYIAFLGAISTTRRIRVTLLSILLGMMVVFPLADYFRRSDRSSVAVQVGLVSEYDANPDYDSFPQIVNSVTVTRVHGLSLGGQALGVVGFFVPRAVWPGKPRDTALWIADLKGYDFQNLSAPLWAEFYVNFGIFGVFVGFAGVGVALAYLDERLLRNFRSLGVGSLASVFLSIYTIIVLRGSLLQAMALPCLLISSMLSIRRRFYRKSKPT